MPKKSKAFRRKTPSAVVIKAVCVAVAFLLLLSVLGVKSLFVPEGKTIFLPTFHVSFSVPKGYTTSEKEYGSSYVASLYEVTSFSPGTYTKKVSDFKNRGIKVVYSLLRPWTPNFYNIPSSTAFDGTAKTTLLDSKKIIPVGSSLRPGQVRIYTYLLGDDSGHGRGRYGVAYQGDVRLDFATKEHVRASEAVFFKCLDPKAGSNVSHSCEGILTLFLKSLKVEGAKVLASPPSFESGDYWAGIEPTKKNFDPLEMKLPTFFAQPEMGFAYFSGNDNELLDLPDSSLQSIRCMPQQIYMEKEGSPPNLINHGEKNLYSIRTTDGNNSYFKVYINDSALLSLISGVGGNNRLLTNFSACQTGEGGYVAQYNGQKYAPYHAGDQSVNYISENTPVTEIETIDKAGNTENIVSIPLPQKIMSCERPLALTTDGMFYLACNYYFYDNVKFFNVYGRYIYKIDLKGHSYSQLSQCQYSYIDSNPSKSVRPVTTCN